MANAEDAGTTSPILKLGIIGLGGGASQMIPTFDNHPHIRLVAAADVDQGLLETFQRTFQGETYLSAAALCKHAEADAVYIATPNQFHTEHAVMALTHGKHVLVEKPMTLTLADADHMIDTATRHGLQLAVNVKHSFEPRIRRIREIVCNAELGRLRMLHYWYFNDWLYSPRTAEELNPDLGGGVPWRQGPHQFDILRTIGGGLVRSVRATTGVWDDHRPVAGAYTAFLEFEDGAVATAVYSGHDHFNSKALTYQVDAAATWTPPPYARARQALRQVTGAEAETALKRARRFGGASQVANPSSPWILGGPFIASFDNGDVRLTPNGFQVYGEDAAWEEAAPSDIDGRDGVVDQFYNAVVHGKRPANDGLWGKATLEVLLALLQSGKERREVFLSHQVVTPDRRYL